MPDQTNRPFSDDVARRYAEDMIAGKWKLDPAIPAIEVTPETAARLRRQMERDAEEWAAANPGAVMRAEREDYERRKANGFRE